MEKLIEETRTENKLKYHEKDLKLTVTQDQLFKEMLHKVSYLSEEFRIATEKRVNKTERKTLEINYTLNEKLIILSNKMLYIIGKNKSYQQATQQLKYDVHVLQDIRNEMHKKWLNQLQSLKNSISNCLKKEQRLCSIMEIFLTNENIHPLNLDIFFYEQIKNMNMKEVKLTEEVKTLRSKHDHTLSRYEEYKHLRNEELHRLKQLIQARNHLCQLVIDCKTALQQACEMCEPESAVKLNLTERIQRHDHLLTAFFILIYTCDQLISRITPYQIGDFRLNRITTNVPSASTKQSFGRNRVMFSDSVYPISTSSLAKSDSRTRNALSGKSNSEDSSYLEFAEKDHFPHSEFPLASEFGLEPMDPKKPSTVTNILLKELSKCSRQSERRTTTPIVHSVAVQTEPLYGNTLKSKKFKEKIPSELVHLRNNRGVLQLPFINSTVIAPKESYDELYTFNIRPTYKQKSPTLPSLYQLAKF
ncbi:unnamed protein product [Heterobilharzia americana]|nr:unnamed protein product [Heterobilharzia americana]